MNQFSKYYQSNCSKINQSEISPQSFANICLFSHYINQIRDLNGETFRKNLQSIENIYLDKVLQSSELRDDTISLWKNGNITNIPYGGRHLNDIFFYYHEYWLQQNSSQDQNNSPFYPLLKILLRGGYLWKYKSYYMIGEINAELVIHSNENFVMPDLNDDFLDFLDVLRIENKRLPCQLEINEIYSKFHS